MSKLLVTGGAGFIGSNFIHYWLKKYPKDVIVNLDALTYSGNLENLKDLKGNKRHRFIKGDITNPKDCRRAMKGIDVIVNFAAESHNDRAILDPAIFVKTNVLGTQILLEEAKVARVKRFHHISTCEVFGDLEIKERRKFKETDPYLPKTPYNASKAAANHIVMAYFHTFKLPVTISHCANNLGPYQYPEKVIPRFVTNLIDEHKIPLYKSSHFKREWIHVDDHNHAVEMIIKRGRPGEAYNIGTGVEKSVEEIADSLLKVFNLSNNYKKYVPDRKQHDKRYLLDTTKIRKALGWKPEISFTDALRSTILWYKENEWWWRPLKKRAEDLYAKTKQK